MDRAGYCFGTNLGKALFGNVGCTGKKVSLATSSKATIRQIRALEARYTCRINTRRNRLELKDVAIRMRLVDLPIFDELPGGCLGWMGDATVLFAAHDRAAAKIGNIEAGDFVKVEHTPVGDWTYVTVYERNWSRLKSGGWYMGTIKTMKCRDFAG